MIKEISAGGVVVLGNAILLLMKYNGDWVLPKGRVEENEEIEEAALREVYEEGSVKAELNGYIGEIHYQYRFGRNKNLTKDKTVHWYLMKARNMKCHPQKEEGFINAKYIHIDRAIELAKYDEEKDIIRKAKIEINKEAIGDL